MDGDLQRRSPKVEAQAELIEKLIAKGFYIWTQDGVGRWHAARRGTPDYPASGGLSEPGTLETTVSLQGQRTEGASAHDPS